MVAPRRAASIFGRVSWVETVDAIDWTRVLIEARGKHIRDHDGDGEETCAQCLKHVVAGRNWNNERW